MSASNHPSRLPAGDPRREQWRARIAATARESQPERRAWERAHAPDAAQRAARKAWQTRRARQGRAA